MTPGTLTLPPVYPGNPYSHTIDLIAGTTRPTASVRLFRAPGDRALPLADQARATVLDDMSNPNRWKLRLEISNTRNLPRSVWVELTIDGRIEQTGYLSINY